MRPKDIGTRAESAVVKALKPYFPDAERIALKGGSDQGDIGWCGDFIFEVKGGQQTKQIGDKLLQEWMDQTRHERNNRQVAYGVLVIQRHGKADANRWWAYIDIGNFCSIVGSGYRVSGDVMPIRLELGELLAVLADNGATIDADAA
jgi:hypothetical protein